MSRIAKFNIGDCVFHQQLGYRGVVIDADPIFQASGQPNPQAHKRAFTSRNPWYRILVDNSSQITYVEECQLVLDKSLNDINNPNVDNYLTQQEGRYHRNSKPH